MGIFEKIDITPVKGNIYIGGISLENTMRLFNLLYNDSQLDEIKISTRYFPMIHPSQLFHEWVYQAYHRHLNKIKEIKRLPSEQIPNEWELMHDVLKNDLRGLIP